jgi:AraC-like DNA-binding protein
MKLPEDLPLRIDIDSISDDRPITRLHVHECLEIGLCHEGSGVFMINDRLLPFAAGSLSCIPHGAMHYAQSTPGTTSRWTWLFFIPERMPLGFESGPFTTQAGGGFPLTPMIVTPNGARNLDASMESTIRQLGKELATRQFAYREAVYHLVSMLRIGIYRLHSVEAADLPQTDPSSLARVAPAISWISEHYKQELYIDELADRCNMSPTVFREQFRKATLTSPMEYINRFRVHLAAGMLGNREARVVDIALAIGFESPSSLNRWFRLVKGISPKKYQSRFQ